LGIIVWLNNWTAARLGVYRAEHLILKTRTVAIKILHAHLATQQKREGFFQEAGLLEMLKHPHILPILDVGIQDSFPYLVTEYCSEGSLRRRLKRQRPNPLPMEEVSTILTQVGQALQYVHEQNVVHRDLKPENILFNSQGEALLADFGIAKMLATIGVRQGTITGTPPYMSPEQFRGTASKEGDQYALGCIAYELFTGRRPFTAPDMVGMMYKHLTEQPIAPRQLNPQLPVHFEQAILTAMAKERKARHADVATFIAALQKSALQKSAQQWLNEGNALNNLKRTEEALAAFEQAIHLDPNSAVAYHNKGNALYELKRYQEALAAFEQVIRLDSNDAVAYYGKGNALRDLKRYPEALAAYEQAIHLDPSFAAAYNNKGFALKALGKKQDAQQAYERARQLGYSS
jgi:serine/threonine protein kinase